MFIVQNYDVIKTVINLIKSERSQRLLRLEINLIAHFILRDTKDYDSLNPQDAVALDPLNIETAFLEQFMSYKGHEVLEDVKHQFRENESIFNIITAFQETILRHAYDGFQLNSMRGVRYKEANSMDPAVYLKATTFMI